jgi:salicylate hydroxylase
MIVGAGMGGLTAALSMRESGRFEAIDVYEQTREPATAGAGLNVAPNGARICRWLGIDLDGGDPKGAHGAVDGGRAAILPATRQVMPDGSVSVRPLNHMTAAGDGAGFHHMHRLDLLMAMYKRVFEFAPETGARCPISVHMGKRLATLAQDADSVTATFTDGTSATAEVLVGADGMNSKVLQLCWPDAKPRRWTGVSCYRGLIPRDKVAGLRKPDGSAMDNNPIDAYTMDVIKNDHTFCMTYWVRGGELLNVWMAYFDPQGTDFEADDWFPIDHADMVENLEKGFGDDPRKGDVLAMAMGMEGLTKWGLYDRDAFEHWVDGRICLLGDAAHPMLPFLSQGAAMAIEDAYVLAARLAGERDPAAALAQYEGLRRPRTSRVQLESRERGKTYHLSSRFAQLRRDLAFFVRGLVNPQATGIKANWVYAYDAIAEAAGPPLAAAA